MGFQLRCCANVDRSLTETNDGSLVSVRPLPLIFYPVEFLFSVRYNFFDSGEGKAFSLYVEAV